MYREDITNSEYISRILFSPITLLSAIIDRLYSLFLYILVRQKFKQYCSNVRYHLSGMLVGNLKNDKSISLDFWLKHGDIVISKGGVYVESRIVISNKPKDMINFLDNELASLTIGG